MTSYILQLENKISMNRVSRYEERWGFYKCDIHFVQPKTRLSFDEYQILVVGSPSDFVKFYFGNIRILFNVC